MLTSCIRNTDRRKSECQIKWSGLCGQPAFCYPEADSKPDGKRCICFGNAVIGNLCIFATLLDCELVFGNLVIRMFCILTVVQECKLVSGNLVIRMFCILTVAQECKLILCYSSVRIFCILTVAQECELSYGNIGN
jgi:hypothetical protein